MREEKKNLFLQGKKLTPLQKKKQSFYSEFDPSL